MSHKHFALIIALWAIIMLLVFAPAAEPAEIGTVQTPVVITCEESLKDGGAALNRIVQLRKMLEKTEDQSGRLVLRTEISAVENLIISIQRWRIENCRTS